jgi:biopolymer transport protein ExbD
MNFIPYDELRTQEHIHLAPMIDFLFLILALFATLALSKSALHTENIELVQLQSDATTAQSGTTPKEQIHLGVFADGSYHWIKESQLHPLPNTKAIQEELVHQHRLGLLPKDKRQTEILLHIDQNASWGPVANLLFAIRELGFDAYPVYETHPTNLPQ